jgi:hypothetical protein
MKVQCIFPGRAVAAPKKTAFGQVLKQQPPALPKPAAKPLAAVPPNLKAARIAAPPSAAFAPPAALAANPTAAALTTARSTSHAKATLLADVRSAHQVVANERLEGRLLDLICKELVIEFSTDAKLKVANQDLPLPPPTPNLPATAPAAQLAAIAPPSGGRAEAPSVKAAAAVELIEKIETFIKDSRTPAIALTLNNSLGAKVEIERIGPREVALRVVGRNGPPRAEDISRIREEMQARGLKVGALSVA